MRATTSPVLSMMRLDSTDQVLISRQDGSVTLYLTGGRVELTGSDTDPVYCLAEDAHHVYTGCRDGEVRKYDRKTVLNLVELYNNK